MDSFSSNTIKNARKFLWQNGLEYVFGEGWVSSDKKRGGTILSDRKGGWLIYIWNL